MECTLCKIQYVRIAETPCNIRSNNHRADVSDPNAIPDCSQMTYAKLTLIETKINRNKPTDVILRKHKNFWINTLETLHPHCLNQELNP